MSDRQTVMKASLPSLSPLSRSLLSPLSVLATAIALLMLLIGCSDKPATDSSTEKVGAEALEITLPEIPAADYLKRVLARYRNTRSYRDVGEVRLRVEKDGRLTRRTAPMHVMLDGSTIWLAAYDARLWSDDGKTIGWIADEQTRFHDSQVVVGGSSAARRSSSRPVLENLLRDPTLTSRMVLGLGGPPPQLEWLLDPEPMAKIFRGGVTDQENLETTPTIQYEGLAEREHVQCVVVRALAGKDLYRFWIDRQKSLIHCVDLPVSMAGKQAELDGWTVQSLELVLVDASFEPPESAYQLTEMPMAEFPARPRYLRSLVPLPPPPPDRRLGTTVGAFESTDLTGQIKLTRRGAGRAFTLWYACLLPADSEAERRSLQAVNTLTAWLRQSSESIRSNVQPVILVDDDFSRFFVDAGLTKTEWALLPDRDGNVRQRIGIEPGQAALVDSRGRLVWIGDATSSAAIGGLGAVARDAILGVDVPARIRRQWESDRDAYRQKLDELAVE